MSALTNGAATMQIYRNQVYSLLIEIRQPVAEPFIILTVRVEKHGEEQPRSVFHYDYVSHALNPTNGSWITLHDAAFRDIGQFEIMIRVQALVLVDEGVWEMQMLEIEYHVDVMERPWAAV